AYACRHLAKNVVAAGLADRCEIQVAYAIGVARPVSLRVETFGTGKVEEEKIAKALLNLVDLRPAAIIQRMGLRRPIYTPLAAYGHMGRTELDLPWEKTDLADNLKKILLP
ncbi:MAG: methionine adenosyltransferase domain-containing protein, partial [Clostridia bacterium]|nr:methionine adenosyltransferase domain-containing protein [Clostridia bacterium]